jgi:deoxyribonuclease V
VLRSTSDRSRRLIAAFDAHYFGDDRACAAAVFFQNYTDAESAAEYVTIVLGIQRYMTGYFYRRELPCILKVFEQFVETPNEMVIDGYVMLGDRPGLGRHVFEFFSGRIPVIGVAKSKYRNSSGVEVLRGGSRRPLYVTAAGLDPHEASERIRSMHGAHRMPTLLKRVDLLAREKTGCPSR